jgi:hypothetical protein
LSEILDVLDLLPTQALKSKDLCAQPLQLGLVSCSPSYQVLSKVVVASRSRPACTLGRAISFTTCSI